MNRSIYVISPEGGPVKVGIASAANHRLSALQTGSPVKLELRYSRQVVGDVALLEKSVHEALSNQRSHGEWFNVPVSEAIETIETLAKRLGHKLVDSSAQMIQFRAKEHFFSKVDRWRERQDEIPSRAEAVRRLVEKGLDAG